MRKLLFETTEVPVESKVSCFKRMQRKYPMKKRKINDDSTLYFPLYESSGDEDEGVLPAARFNQSVFILIKIIYFLIVPLPAAKKKFLIIHWSEPAALPKCLVALPGPLYVTSMSKFHGKAMWFMV